MFLVGLTGGIASGKSTVANHWVDLGAIEIDADKLAREVIAKDTVGAAAIRQHFGDAVFSNSGELDRQKLADIVFRDASKRLELEAIIHPLVRAASMAAIDSAAPGSIVVYNVPLLVEAKVDLPFDIVVTVEAPAEKQIERMIATRGMTEAQAKERISAQASPTARANRADEILNSNQSLELLIKDARKLWSKIERLAEEKQKQGSF